MAPVLNFELPPAAPRPALGRIVHVNTAHDRRAAIVTHVYPDGFTIDATVFNRDDIPTPMRQIPYLPTSTFGWQWPERV